MATERSGLSAVTGVGFFFLVFFVVVFFFSFVLFFISVSTLSRCWVRRVANL